MLKIIVEPTYLTVAEAAKALNASAQTVRNWTEEGRIEVYGTEGGHRRYLLEDVEHLAAVNRAKAMGYGEALYEYEAFMRRIGTCEYELHLRGKVRSAEARYTFDDKATLASFSSAIADYTPFAARADNAEFAVSPIREGRDNGYVKGMKRLAVTGQAQTSYIWPIDTEQEGGGTILSQQFHGLGNSRQQCLDYLAKTAYEIYLQLRDEYKPVVGVVGFRNSEDELM